MSSKVKQLKEMLGGNWEYNPQSGQWDCGDGRYVCRVHTGGYDLNGEPMPGFGYFLYGTDKLGERIYFNEFERKFFARQKKKPRKLAANGVS